MEGGINDFLLPDLLECFHFLNMYFRSVERQTMLTVSNLSSTQVTLSAASEGAIHGSPQNSTLR